MPSVRALMADIIDYAGLFPPARLDMAQAVRDYAAHRAGRDAWMLGAFILPCSRLDEFASAAREVLRESESAEPWPLSAPARPADDPDLTADLAAIARFNKAHARADAGRAAIESIELKASDAAGIDRALDLMPDALFAFFELPADRDVRGMVAAMAGLDAGAKVRTGGLTADLFPPPEALATFIHACATTGVPFKATAGLHHPFTHDSRTVVGAKEFGFVNLFVGAALLSLDRIDRAQLTEALSDEAPADFSFKDDSIIWKGCALSAQEMEEVRSKFALSFGSCSFVEPLDGLRALGLL